MLLLLAIAGLFFLPSPWGVAALCAAAVVEVGEYWAWKWFLGRYRVTTGAEGMVGTRAAVIERCDPVGRVRMRGEIWAARSDVPVEAGESVVVTGVEGLTLVIEPA